MLNTQNYIPTKNYYIYNPKTNYILAQHNNLKYLIQKYWNHIPRRKTSELFLISNISGEILKTKSKKV